MWAAAKHILSTDAAQRMRVALVTDLMLAFLRYLALFAELAWKVPRLSLGQVCDGLTDAVCLQPQCPHDILCHDAAFVSCEERDILQCLAGIAQYQVCLCVESTKTMLGCLQTLCMPLLITISAVSAQQ